MKIRTLALIASAVSLAATANAQSLSSHFINLDFDAGGVSNPFKGFDAPAAPDIIGWTNLNNAASLNDAGVEGAGAWWGVYQDKSAFMSSGDGAYNLSDYTIQAGDIFSIDFYAKSWPWTSDGIGEWTVSLYYDTPANTFGSYTSPALGDNSTWLHYTSSPIAATGASEGGKLGVIFLSSGGDISQLDEIQINIVPEPSVISLMAVAGVGMLLRRRQLVK